MNVAKIMIYFYSIKLEIDLLLESKGSQLIFIVKIDKFVLSLMTVESGKFSISIMLRQSHFEAPSLDGLKANTCDYFI